MTTENPSNLIESVFKLQSQGVELLLEEVRALALMMPGANQPDAMAAEVGTATGCKTEAETDAQIEAGFDNMPI